MRELRVTLETVTPLFLRGADNETPELRPPSFRGVMRYWWRIGYSSQMVDFSRDQLFEAESRIFGNTNSASPILVRLRGEPARTTLERPEQPAGLNYLMYGMHERKKKGNRTIIQYSPAIAPGERFELVLGIRSLHHINEVLRQAAISLWLLCNLGGLGARVRRGAGALRAVELTGDWPQDLPALQLQAASPTELSEKLGEGLSSVITSVENPKGFPIPSLHPQHSIVTVFEKTWDSWDSALDEVGQVFQKFRSRREPDYTNIKQFIKTGAAPETVERAAFGLPLPFYYRSLRGAKAMIDGQESNKQGEIARRSASPLWFRVSKLSSGDYAVLLFVFISPLLPQGYQLRLSSPGCERGAAVPGQNVIAEFMEYAGKQVAPLLEVKY